MPLVARPEPIDDFFSVPVGTVPQVDPEHSEDHSVPFPPEVNDHRGKCVAIRGDKIIAVRDTDIQLLVNLVRRSNISVDVVG
jgi:hypothetical protein